MGENERNGRTHEPNLREVTTELDGFRSFMDERDRRYGERALAQERAFDAALVANKELTTLAFASSKEAVLKAEASQRDSNEKNNEFRGQLKDQAATFMPTKDCERQLDEIRHRTAVLEQGSSVSTGKGAGLNAMWGYILGAAGFIISMALLLLRLMGK